MKALIVARFEPCRCGCHGKDTQHAATFTRELRDVQLQSGMALVRGRASKVEFDRVATAKLPWGVETVVRSVIRVDGIKSYGNWYIAQEVRYG